MNNFNYFTTEERIAKLEKKCEIYDKLFSLTAKGFEELVRILDKQSEDHSDEHIINQFIERLKN